MLKFCFDLRNCRSWQQGVELVRHWFQDRTCQEAISCEPLQPSCSAQRHIQGLL